MLLLLCDAAIPIAVPIVSLPPPYTVLLASPVANPYTVPVASLPLSYTVLLASPVANRSLRLSRYVGSNPKAP